VDKIGDHTALMSGSDFRPSDPFVIEHIYKTIRCGAPHGKILGWIRWDEPKSRGRMFHIYSHWLDKGDAGWG